MLVIPAIWKAKLVKSLFEANLGKKLARPSLKNKLAMVIYVCNPSNPKGRIRMIWCEASPKQKYETIYKKISKAKRLG
jgi:hypothetical protein